jgi:hypothetical protein
MQGKSREFPPVFDSPMRIRLEIPERFRGRKVKFPMIQNKELVLTNRETLGNRSGL